MLMHASTRTQSLAVTLVQRHITTSRPSAEDRDEANKARIKALSQPAKKEFRNTDEHYRTNTQAEFYFLSSVWG